MERPPFLPLPQGLRIAGLHQEETMLTNDGTWFNSRQRCEADGT
jgi:hypothetical protein